MRRESEEAGGSEALASRVAADKQFSDGPITKDSLYSGKKTKILQARVFSMSEEKEKYESASLPKPHQQQMSERSAPPQQK